MAWRKSIVGALVVAALAVPAVIFRPDRAVRVATGGARSPCLGQRRTTFTCAIALAIATSSSLRPPNVVDWGLSGFARTMSAPARIAFNEIGRAHV